MVVTPFRLPVPYRPHYRALFPAGGKHLPGRVPHDGFILAVVMFLSRYGLGTKKEVMAMFNRIFGDMVRCFIRCFMTR